MNKGSVERKIALFIDDEKVCHMLAELIIPHQTPYELMCASTGSEALKIAEEFSDRIDIILTDVMLPDMSGFDIYDTLRRQEAFKSTPFIFQSGLAINSEERFKYASENSYTVLYKPYKRDDLLAAIQKITQPK